MGDEKKLAEILKEVFGDFIDKEQDLESELKEELAHEGVSEQVIKPFVENPMPELNTEPKENISVDENLKFEMPSLNEKNEKKPDENIKDWTQSLEYLKMPETEQTQIQKNETGKKVTIDAPVQKPVNFDASDRIDERQNTDSDFISSVLCQDLIGLSDLYAKLSNIASKRNFEINIYPSLYKEIIQIAKLVGCVYPQYPVKTVNPLSSYNELLESAISKLIELKKEIYQLEFSISDENLKFLLEKIYNAIHNQLEIFWF